MGIILKQSFKNLLTTYLGFGIGAINTLFLYTNFLEQEYYGLVSFLLSAANLIWPLMAFGVHNTLVKFYSSYPDREDRDKLLSMVLAMPMLVSFILGGLGYVFYESILGYFSDGNELVQDYVWLIFVVAIATSYFEVFFSWAKVNYRSVFGNFMKEVFHRLCISFLLLAVYFGWLAVKEFIYMLSLVYVLRAVIMKIYAFTMYFPNIKFALPANWVSIVKYSALILIAGSVAMVLLDLDKVMIEHYLPIENVAIYAIAIYISSVIGVPSRAMHQITYPLTAILLNKKDREGLKNLYEKSSISLLVVSGLIFILIVSNLQQIYELIPDEYDIPFSIVVLVSAVKLYDNLLGNNNSILYNSDYYRLVLAIGVMLAVLAFILNTIFIPEFGILGAAIATFLAFAVYNSVKLFIVFQKFKIHPFTVKTLYGLMVITVFSLLFPLWDTPFHPVLNILLKSAVIGLLYLLVIYWLHLSKDINAMVEKYLKFPRE